MSWTHTFDFTASDGAWSAFDIGADYVSNVGWRSRPGYGGYVIYLEHAGFPQSTINQMDITFSYDNSPRSGNGFIDVGGSQSSWSSLTSIGPHTKTFNNVSGQSATRIALAIGDDDVGGDPNTPSTLTNVVVRGSGINPFINEETECSIGINASHSYS